MSLYKNKYRVESARLRGYDYGSPGEYFVTICTYGRAKVFGTVIEGCMVRTELGEIAHHHWLDIPKHHENVLLDDFVVMPDHVHGIVVLSGPHRNVLASDGARNVAATDNLNMMSVISPKRGSLGAVVRSYKSAVTYWCHANGYEDFQWQAGFHDHIIRNSTELDAIRVYIRNNPEKWSEHRNLPSKLPALL